MDTSINYIKMCQAAERIQGKHWNPRQADICCLMNGDHPEIGFLVATRANRDEMNREWSENNEYLYFQHFDEHWRSQLLISPNRPYTWSNWTFDKHSYIWLPRQDQLQNLMSAGQMIDFNIWKPLKDYIGSALFPHRQSPEKVWLRLTMMTKFKLGWEEETGTWVTL